MRKPRITSGGRQSSLYMPNAFPEGRGRVPIEKAPLVSLDDDLSHEAGRPAAVADVRRGVDHGDRSRGRTGRAPMSNDTIPGLSPEGSPQETLKGRRLGIILCAVSAIVTLAAVGLIAGRLSFASEEEMRAKDTEELREIALQGGQQPGPQLHAGQDEAAAGADRGEY